MQQIPRTLTHFTMDGFQGFRSRFDDVKLVQELLEEVPAVLKLKPVMPPFLQPYYNGIVAEDCGISGFVLLAGGHLTLHTFSFRECFFADLVAPGAFDTQRAQLTLQTTLPCRSVFTQTVERGEGADARRPIGPMSINPSLDFGPHLFVRFSPYQGPTTMDDLFDLFDRLPPRIGMTPIMRPYVIKTAAPDGGRYLSALTMIAESHVSLHVYPDSREAYFDLFSCKFFDTDAVLRVLFQDLGGNAAEQELIARGQRYAQLRTERKQALSQTNRWLATTHPDLHQLVTKIP
ncbi:MAG: S-adenosylmethionine decarboxylase [Polyangiaceae bacterium]|nr:S-adenosylmethionine decarboxylase [Polyangiaceae bacterium]